MMNESMWLCPNGHEIDQYSQLESWKKKPCLARSALKRGLFNHCHNVCQKCCGFSYGCSLILNRNWTIDELILEIRFEDIVVDCPDCIIQGSDIRLSESTWQPKYLGNTEVSK